jgi:hypothetical protein
MPISRRLSPNLDLLFVIAPTPQNIIDLLSLPKIIKSCRGSAYCPQVQADKENPADALVGSQGFAMEEATDAGYRVLGGLSVGNY